MNNKNDLQVLAAFAENADNLNEITYVCGRCNTIFSSSDNLADVETEKDLCPHACGNDAIELLGQDVEEVIEAAVEYFDLDSNEVEFITSELGPYLNIEHL